MGRHLQASSVWGCLSSFTGMPFGGTALLSSFLRYFPQTHQDFSSDLFLLNFRTLQCSRRRPAGCFAGRSPSSVKRKGRNDMRIHSLKVLLWAGMLSLCGTAAARIQAQNDTLDLRIYYRQGDARLDEDYRQNGVHLSSVLDALRRLADGSPDAVRRLEIVSGASPEGRADFNLH